MQTISLFGTGKIGETICALVSASGRYKVRACDIDVTRAEVVAKMFSNVTAHQLKLDNQADTLALLKGSSAVISALPYFCNPTVASLADKAGSHYFDLTEDVETTRKVAKLAATSKMAFMPQCGLAPGFISIAAGHLVKAFDSVDTVKMRVGALPIFPSNKMKYNLTWSTDGLINEYGNLCEGIENGTKMTLLPLEGYERFSLDGVEYEAFNTSGGLGTLCETLAGKVKKLNYKTLRYPGHHDYVTLLMNDLKFNEDRETLKKVFERSLATTKQDKCVILVEVTGTIKGKLVQKTYASTVYNSTIGKHHFGAIQITTAAGILAPMDMYLNGKLGQRGGFITCEEISLTDFLANEFGKHYRDEKALGGIEA